MPHTVPARLRTPWLLLAAAVVAYLVALALTAWLCDDAYLTYRVVDNLVQGHGLRWNIGDRVQVFTHPLWLLLNLPFYAMTREPYYTFLVTSLLTTVVCLGLLVAYLRATPLRAAAAVALLVLAKAHVDFATAGLENPLLNLLLVVFVFTVLSPRPDPAAQAGRLALLAALLTLCRPDAALLAAPALAWRLWRTHNRAAWVRVVLGSTPLVAWAVFALVYYGSALPNTAYAKLGAGIPVSALAAQGWRYFGLSLLLDRVTLPVIVLGLALAVGRRAAASRALAAGIAAHLLFVVLAGGDFMSGRLLTPAFLVAVLLVVEPMWGLRPRPLGLVVAVAASLGLSSPFAPLRTAADYDLHADAQRQERHHGVGDERAFYYPTTGLLRAGRFPAMPAHRFAEIGRAFAMEHDRPTIAADQASGMYAFFAGPNLWLVDRLGLGDAFMARRPLAEPGRWRIGHYARKVPDGYLASLATGTDTLADRGLVPLLRDVRLATRAPLLAPGRVGAIWRLAIDADRSR